MYVYLIDHKHQRIRSKWSFDLSEQSEINLVQRLISFLEENQVVDGRYTDLVLANTVEQKYEDGEPILVIDGVE